MIAAKPVSEEDRPVLVTPSQLVDTPASVESAAPDGEVITLPAPIPVTVPSETEDSETEGSEAEQDPAGLTLKHSSGLGRSATIAEAVDTESDSDDSNSVVSAPNEALPSSAEVSCPVTPTAVPVPPPASTRQQAALMEQVTVQAMSALRVSMTSFAVDGISESMDVIADIATAPLTLPVKPL
jgi:hypothetical protein